MFDQVLNTSLRKVCRSSSRNSTITILNNLTFNKFHTLGCFLYQVNLFDCYVLFSYPLITWKNQSFSDVFRAYRNGTSSWSRSRIFLFALKDVVSRSNSSVDLNASQTKKFMNKSSLIVSQVARFICQAFVVDLAEVDKVRTAIPIHHQKRNDVYETWDSNNKC